MSDIFKNIKYAYFIGIGGAGMSAIARYFHKVGIYTAGYDKVYSQLSRKLGWEGINVHYHEDLGSYPTKILEAPKDEVLVVYTPAMPNDHEELKYFRENGYTLKKRAKVLGIISKNYKTIAVAGTHGKTSVSTLISHILHNSTKETAAIIGGISKNYDSNLILPKNVKNIEIFVTEADEFDKSFLHLYPQTAVITAIDEDHLDIYKDINDIKLNFGKFISQINKNGCLIIHKRIDIEDVDFPANVYTYSSTEKADFYAENIVSEQGKTRFDFVSENGKIKDIELKVPGIVNVENAVAAAASALLHGATDEEIKEGLGTWEGVKRRFDYIINDKKIVYIDDYAHHPEELKAFITTVKDLYPKRRITGIFQPHLFTRTRDFAEGFAKSLSQLDELILLDIYPAREKPIEGVTSKLIFDKVTIEDKILCDRNDLMKITIGAKYDVLLTIGAGDIDRFVESFRDSITEIYEL